ncbi:Uncharacterized protein Adt_46375 [Abeliophyllum distichum]|uniref:PB1-like domain-containing protein n=1 Tax=Abeliophyllum distichum TaxID=126358 RepID=A0ABD1P2M3_9LAMI
MMLTIIFFSVVGENSKYFTIAWHYGGRFYLKPNNLAYEHGVVDYIDFVDPDEVLKLTVRMLDRFLKRFGYKLPMEFFYRRYKMSLLVGLVRMKSLDDLKGMVSAIGASKVVEVYMVTPTITFCLPWDSPNVKWRSNVIITEILETDMNRESISEIVIEPESQPLRGVDVSEDWESDFIESFVQRLGSEELRQQGEGEFEGDRQTDVGEDGRRDENDILVESDYEMDEPQVEPTNVNNVNIDIGFGEFVEGSSRSESDYGDSDELESLDSEGELPKRRRTRDEFNPRVDMVNPQFKTAAIKFEIKKNYFSLNQCSRD